MQCIRLEGVNSTTSEDGHLDRIGALMAGIVAQAGTGFSFYLHKVSKAVEVDLPPIEDTGFAGEIDRRWRAHLRASGLRDKTPTLTVLKRPGTGRGLRFLAAASRARLAQDTVRRLRKLDEVVGFILSTFDEMLYRESNVRDILDPASLRLSNVWAILASFVSRISFSFPKVLP